MKYHLTAVKRKKFFPWLLAALLALLVFVAYARVIHAGYIWDDDYYVSQNEALRSTQGLKDIWVTPRTTPQYYPVTFSAFWIQYQLWGLNPFGYHAVNIVLHVANALLFVALLQWLRIPGAWLAGFLFALHPVHLESVAWISELKNVLSTAFFLVAALAYIRFGGASFGQKESPHRLWFLLLSFLCYVLALFSKSVTVVLPVGLAFLLYLKKGVLSRHAVTLGIFLAIGAAAGARTLWVETHLAGAAGPEWSYSVVQRVLMAGRSFWFYVGKLFWPHPIMFIYPKWILDPSQWTLYLYPAAFVLVFGILWFGRHRFSRGPWVGFGFFAAALFPALGFLNFFPMRYSLVADHFQYLASLGLIALVASAGWIGYQSFVKVSSWAGWCACGLICLPLLMVTIVESAKYDNAKALWHDTLRKNPTASIAHNNLGALALHGNRMSEALQEFEAALRLKPDGESFYNVGTVLGRMGRCEEAMPYLQKAITLGPSTADMHNDLGNCLRAVKRYDEAVQEYRRAIPMASAKEVARIKTNLANVLRQH